MNNDIVNLANNALKITEERILENGSYGVYLHAKNQLKMIIDIAISRNPSADEKSVIDIDLMAVKELEVDDFDYASILCQVAYDFKRL